MNTPPHLPFRPEKSTEYAEDIPDPWFLKIFRHFRKQEYKINDRPRFLDKPQPAEPRNTGKQSPDAIEIISSGSSGTFLRWLSRDTRPNASFEIPPICHLLCM
jgi:hypothetical protein